VSSSKTAFRSLRNKITRTFLFVMGSTTIATLAIIVITSAQASSVHLSAVQKYIEQGITSKGKVLTENHARALRGLTMDNALLDMQGLVARVVQEDSDLVYGLYVNADGETMAASQRGARARAERPAKDEWRALGIAQDELLVKGETIKRVVRLGQDLLEVAVPVTDDEGEILGTVRYGLSTRPMHVAIAQAQGEARSRLLRSVLLLGLMIMIATMLGLAGSGVMAKRITAPITELTVAAEARAKGNRAVSVKANSDDEIGLLGESFNRMGEDLDASYRELEELNRDLEKKVEQRTGELDQKNQDMRLVLDNVGQGFLTVDAHGNLSNERSRIVDEWFGPPEAGCKLTEFLRRIDKNTGDWFEVGWDMLVEGIMPMAVCLDQLPAVVRSQGRTFELAYRPLVEEDGEKLHKVIVVITDVTARVERERSERAQRETMSLFKHALSDRQALDSFFAETGGLVDDIVSARDPDLTLLRRQVHTVKGNAATFGLESVARLCHELEDKMDANERPSSLEDRRLLAETWAKVVAMRDELTKEATGGIDLDLEEYEAFVQDLRDNVPHQQLLQSAVGWRFEAAHKYLTFNGEQLIALARRLGRADVDVVIQPTRLRLHSLKWRPFWSAFTHVVRNTVDHGIGTPEERAAAGKSPRARVQLAIDAVGDDLVVRITDDGPGISWQRVACRALEMGLPGKTHNELVDALFADGLSTRDGVTATSGRGVGLSVVRAVVRSLGGSAEISSEPGKGTTFRFRLPRSIQSD
jgi:two-component system chemotaxis sensor kinase CheA